ncbi:MAG: HEAT repeat domain-containing protein [Bryobacterales bacterium]|nr:HEAT repeat domain-containing protein [Bryobacterales bacterium]
MDPSSQLALALEQFASDPVHWGHAMRDLFARDAAGFRQAAVDQLGSFEDTAGFTFLLRLLAGGEMIVPSLLEAASRDKSRIAGIVTATQRVYPMLQVNLGDMMCRCTEKVEPEQERLILQGFSLIDAFSSKLNTLRLLRRLLSSPNGRIRSKAALALSRYSDSNQSMAELLTDPDARVRANAVEALWHRDASVSVPVCRVAAMDPSPRVSANALVGLYFAGQPLVLSALDAMARAGAAGNRASAAWAMGRTGDRRFIPTLKRLLNDSDQVVRSNAIRAAVQIRRSTEAKATSSGDLVVVHSAADLIRFVSAVGVNDTSPINPIKISLEIESTPVLSYSIERCTAPERKAIAVLAPNIPGDRKPFIEAFRRATLSRRPDDTWAVVPYNPSPLPSAVASFDAADSDAKAAGPQLTWLRDVTTLQRAFSDPKPLEDSPAPLLEAVLSCLRRMQPMRFERHIVLLVPDPATTPGSEQALPAILELAQREKTVIHAVMPAEVPAELAAVRRLCRDTGGMAPQSAAEPALDAVLRALTSHLVMRFEAEPRTGAAVLRVESDAGLARADLSIPPEEPK